MEIIQMQMKYLKLMEFVHHQLKYFEEVNLLNIKDLPMIQSQYLNFL